MARCFLPCESDSWPKNRRLFSQLSQLQTVEELDRLIHSHSKEGEEEIIATQLVLLRGLVAFLSECCSEEEREVFFRRTLPFVARSASCLDTVVPEGGLPFVQQQECASVSLSRKLIRSLLANAFLCTFPQEHPLGGGYQQRFGFNHIFDVFLSDKDSVLRTGQVAKLKCILNYFDRSFEQEDVGVSGVVNITRQVLSQQHAPTLAAWLASNYPLCSVVVEKESDIEQSGSRALQVIFSSSCIGGEVLGEGMDQEASKFCSSPEMLVAMLIMDELTEYESIVITGVEQFSSCVQQKDSLAYGGNFQHQYETDVYGNLNTATVAMTMKTLPVDQTYHQETILRELNQALTGYLCHEEQGDLHAHLISLSEWETDDPAAEIELSGIETSSQLTFDDLDDEEEERGEDEIDNAVTDSKIMSLDNYAEVLSADVIVDVLNGLKNSQDSDEKVGNTVEGLAAVLSANAVEKAVRKVDQERGAEISIQAAAESVASTLTDSILSGVAQADKPPSLSCPSPGDATNSYAADLAQEIWHEVKKDLLSPPVSAPIMRITAPVHTSGATTRPGQGEEVATGSRRGSRSSSYTGQPLLLDEYTDGLVEDAIKSGVTAAMLRDENPPEESDIAITVEVPQITRPPGDETTAYDQPDDKTAALASSLVATAFEKAKETIAISPKKTILSMSSVVKQRLSPTKQRKKPKKSPGNKTRKHLGVNLIDGVRDGGGYLQLPMSRMSVAWSTASTRDEESVPTSPTELDHIALGMVNSVDEYSSLLADLIIKEVITNISAPQQLLFSQCADENVLSFRVQTFLHSLEEISPFSSDLETATIPPFSPHCYNLRKSLLRSVATGHRSQGGDPQLQAIIHWMAVSMCGRPEIRYSTFNEESLQQFTEVTEHLQSSNKTVGDLAQALVDYYRSVSDGAVAQTLFTRLLQI